jgi:hypothetical protein
MFFGGGAISRATLSYTFSTNTSNASLNVTSIGGYVAGKSDITVTVNSGIYLWASTTSNYGLTLTGGTTGDTVTLVNNGYIMGAGANGGHRANGSNAGNALSLGFNTKINNTNASAYIGGGGGGGGGGIGICHACGGGGGGAGGGGGGAGNTASGGSGGAIGASGSNGAAQAAGQWGYGGGSGGGGGAGCYGSCRDGGGGGGGRIFPGVGGAGGSSECSGPGGAGGSANNAGQRMANSCSKGGGGGGGGWGASGGGGNVTTSGGTGGKAVALNGYTVTWTSCCTTRIYGSVS